VRSHCEGLRESLPEDPCKAIFYLQRRGDPLDDDRLGESLAKAREYWPSLELPETVVLEYFRERKVDGASAIHSWLAIHQIPKITTASRIIAN